MITNCAITAFVFVTVFQVIDCLYVLAKMMYRNAMDKMEENE